jgi:hypothetical protein
MKIDHLDITERSDGYRGWHVGPGGEPDATIWISPAHVGGRALLSVRVHGAEVCAHGNGADVEQAIDDALAKIAAVSETARARFLELATRRAA